MYVTWEVDARPPLSSIPETYMDEYMADTRTIKYEGEVKASNRNTWGTWIFLVHCSDGELREVKANQVTVLPE